MTEDTYRGSANDPLSLNLYTYCYNDPIKYTDPTGHWASTDADRSSVAQQLLIQYTDDYMKAKAAGNTAGMSAASKAANIVRDNDSKGLYNNIYAASITNKSVDTAIIQQALKNDGIIDANEWKKATTPQTYKDSSNVGSNSQQHAKSNTNPQGTGNGGKNDANYNIAEPWKNKASDVSIVCLRGTYGIGNDNDFADSLYTILPKSMKPKIDTWVKTHQNLAKTNPDLYNTEYANEVLNYYDVYNQFGDIFDTMDSGNPTAILALGVLYGASFKFKGSRATEYKIEIGSKTGYQFKRGIDLDYRGTGKTINNALDEAFKRTGVPRESFKVKEWGKDANGKSYPVKWEAPGGAEVNIDIAHVKQGTPDVPHVGYQTPGKRSQDGGVRGHIFVDDVNVNR